MILRRLSQNSQRMSVLNHRPIHRSHEQTENRNQSRLTAQDRAAIRKGESSECDSFQRTPNHHGRFWKTQVPVGIWGQTRRQLVRATRKCSNRPQRSNQKEKSSCGGLKNGSENAASSHAAATKAGNPKDTSPHRYVSKRPIQAAVECNLNDLY